jgi:hypothetical protein
VPPGGFRAFSVEDDLTVSAKTGGSASQSPQTNDEIPLQFEPGDDPEVAWQKYFATHEPDAAAVREAVRRLKDTKRLDHVIALIGAALRHGQAQPWMYEAMTIAMLAEGRSKEEIERAVMSAADFVEGSADLMYLGVYLTRIGLDRRALAVFRQVAEIEPLRPEPYMHGLEAAQRLNDLEGKQWATLGILSQAWTNDLAEVWKKGLRVAGDTLDQLRAEKRTAEAKQFEAALDEAVRRDCVAIVSWTGDADVDLLVEEPSGTICSVRNPRTSAGGVMLGDGFSRFGRDSSEGYHEVYVCPKGFDGKYRLLARRVWGKVTAGKVSVEVCTHYRGKNAVRICKRIPLENDEALVVFDLKDGRRKEQLREHQVVNAAIGQMALGRQVLAQQLANAVDPQVLGSLALSRAGGESGIGSLLFRGSGAVGYQPVIITLPEGANMSATAVISADRRYVRISPSPIFSGIAEVNVFNTATGEGSAGRGGTGGQGFSGVFGAGGTQQQQPAPAPEGG